jgi:16S rRNA processing protein RimM
VDDQRKPADTQRKPAEARGEPAETQRKPAETRGEPAQTHLAAGRVGRAHGLDGSFYVTHPRARLLTLGVEVTIAGKATTIVRRAGTEQRPIVRVGGIEDRGSAEALRGRDLTVAAADAPKLAAEEWWAHELEGCEVFDGKRRIGTVRRLIELPSCEALEVQVDAVPDAGLSPPGDVRPRAAGGSLLVPMVRDAIRRVDVRARTIDVNMEFIEE